MNSKRIITLLLLFSLLLSGCEIINWDVNNVTPTPINDLVTYTPINTAVNTPNLTSEVTPAANTG